MTTDPKKLAHEALELVRTQSAEPWSKYYKENVAAAHAAIDELVQEQAEWKRQVELLRATFGVEEAPDEEDEDEEDEEEE